MDLRKSHLLSAYTCQASARLRVAGLNVNQAG